MRRYSVIIFMVIIAVALTACGIVSAYEPAHTNTLDPENPDYENPEATTFTVSFDSNGGTSVADITGIESDETISQPTNPTYVYGTFDGWYQDSALQSAWNFTSDTVTADMTLYAQWDWLEVGDTGPGGGTIFYDDTVGFDYDIVADGIQADEKNLFTGKSLDGKRFLEVTDQLWGNLFAFDTDARLAWADPESDLDSITSTALNSPEDLAATVGTGLLSSTTVYNLLDGNQTNRAVQKCMDNTIDGMSDWFVPSVGELNLIFRNGLSLGDLGSVYLYWSSTKIAPFENWIYNVVDDELSQGLMDDLTNTFVRPIRAF